MNNEQNKPIQAQELTEKELEGISGGGAIVLPTATGQEVEWEVEKKGAVECGGGESSVLGSPAVCQFFEAKVRANQ